MDWYEEYNETLSIKIYDFVNNDNFIGESDNNKFEIFSYKFSLLSFNIQNIFFNSISKSKKNNKIIYKIINSLL